MKMHKTRKHPKLHPKLHLNDKDNPWPLTGLYHKHNSSLRLEGGVFMEGVEEAQRKEAMEEVVNVGDINHVR